MIADLVNLVSSAASSLVGTRIYPKKLPQNPTLPAITYNQIDATRTYGLQGDLQKARSRFQIDCRALTYKAARELADKVRQTLSGYYGSMSGTQVHWISLDNERDLFEDEAGVTGDYRVIQDYIISYLED